MFTWFFMDNVTKKLELKDIPANRRLIEELYSHNKISCDAREYALNLLYPHDRWGLWITRILLAIGTSLVLAGIVFFFAFNWNKISPAIKLGSIQLGLVICIISAYFYTLSHIGGKVWLLAASVLVGVFMAVFGQIYQTGADSYQLFMMWAILTLGWTVLSNFSVQWIFWLVITNVFLVLWWQQVVLPSDDMQLMIFAYLTALNGSALVLREYLITRTGFEWLNSQWTRIVPLVALLIIMLIPIIAWIVERQHIANTIKLVAISGLIGHCLSFAFYRYIAKDVWALAAIVLSFCIMFEYVSLKIIAEIFQKTHAVIPLLLAGLITLIIFTSAVIYLRKVAADMETAHA